MKSRYTTSGRDPEFQDLPGSRHPTAPPQVSAGHKRITDIFPTVDLGAPRAASAHPPRAAKLRSAPGPSGAKRDRDRWRTFSSAAARPPAFVRLAFLTDPNSIARPKPGAKSTRRPTRKRSLRRFSSKQTLLGRRSRPARADRRPARTPTLRSARPPSVPRGLGAACTAHQLLR